MPWPVVCPSVFNFSHFQDLFLNSKLDCTEKMLEAFG